MTAQRNPQELPMAIRNKAAIALLDEWLADVSDYDEKAWPLLKEALEANRHQTGERPLFHD